MIDHRARYLEIELQLANSKRDHYAGLPSLSPAQRSVLEAELAELRVIRHRSAEAARMKTRTSQLAILTQKINDAGLGHLAKEAADEARAEGVA